MTVYVLASLIPKPEHQADVATAMQTLIKASRGEAGNQRYDLFANVDGSPGFHLIEVYVDQAALEAHRDSSHYKAYRSTVANWLASPPEVKVLLAVDVIGS